MAAGRHDRDLLPPGRTLSAPPTSPKIGEVRFLKSAGGEGAYPSHELPEVAFAGRSNCGKSSLINTLVGRRRLARVSKTPGRTQLVNFFQMDTRLVLVDLPGYGFARVPIEVRAAWGPMVERYLTGRDPLRALALLLDVRRDPGVYEQRLLAWCDTRKLPVIHVATKIDKLRPGKRNLRLSQLATRYGIPRRALVPFSSVTRDGRDALWRRLLDHTES